MPGAQARLRRVDRNVARRGLMVRRALSVANRTRLRYSEGGWQDDCHQRLEAGTVFRFDELDRLARPDLAVDGEPTGAGLILHDCAQQSWFLTVCAPPQRSDEFLPPVLTLLNRLAGDLVPAFLVSHATGSPDQPSRPTIECVWDRIASPVLLLSRDMTIEAANVAAEELLHEARYFRRGLPNDRLALADRGDEMEIEAAMGRLLAHRRDTARVTLRGLRRARPLGLTLRRAGSPVWRQQFVPELSEASHVLAIFSEAC
ncbi:hypothetical protein [Jiella avicenniae]|uniref:PAS domain-containing protein n=1 Tax=Jiella avicenniae TaxID=2907202 RepID=A0A9X1P0F8_9HYPH|nr:hypothetical protein [Jiella avicenniae]MCE7029017.1 hypothetical protein [Jiella avicenniae]